MYKVAVVKKFCGNLIAAVILSKIYFLKNAKKICKPNNRDLNRDWKNSSPCQFLQSSNSRRYHWILKLFVVTSKSEVWEENDVWLFYCFNFEIKHGVLESNSPCILLNKNTNFDKNKNDKLKVKLWWAGAPERKNRHFLYRLFCPKEIFLTFVFYLTV